MQYNVGPFAQILILPTDLLRWQFPFFFVKLETRNLFRNSTQSLQVRNIPRPLSALASSDKKPLVKETSPSPLLAFTPSPPSWQLFLFTSIDFLPLEPPLPPSPSIVTFSVAMPWTAFRPVRGGWLEKDEQKRKGRCRRAQERLHGSANGKRTPESEKGTRIVIVGLRSNAQRSAKKGGEGFERRGCDGALPSSRHANNFLSPRKAGQGPGGGGQINTSLKSWSQEMVLFLLNDDATYFQPAAIINFVLIPLKVKQGKPSYFLLLIVHIWHCQIKHSME